MSDQEDDYNPQSHKTLLKNISNLGKTQHIRKATRSEPQAQIDEFHLVKPKKSVVSEEPRAKVGVGDIVQVLKTSDKHVAAGKQLKNVISTRKVLPKPLEKPAAQRIKRSIGYDNVKKKLGRWDAIVAKNRSAETQIFPLPSETIYIDTSAHSKPPEKSVKSDLARQMEEAEAKLRQLKRERAGDTTDEKEQERLEQEILMKKMTKEEIKAHRRELAYLRMRESQKSAKARLRNKIKSKKYHKLLKRQKLKEQIKEFELLQKTDPDAALEKLNEIEKSRALERANLRHKNTGSWAKNLQVRAKYDRDVRKDLAEQLQMSRELTQKKMDQNSEDEEEKTGDKLDNEELKSEVDPFNPWVRVTKKGMEPEKEQEDDANWRKYWSERNKNEKLLEEYKKEIDELKNEDLKDSSQESVDEESPQKDLVKLKTLKKKSLKAKEKLGKLNKNPTAKKKVKIENGWIVEPVSPPPRGATMDLDMDEVIEEVPKNNISQKVSKKKAKKPIKNRNIDDIFDEVEDKEKDKLQRKLKKVIKEGKKLEQLDKKLATKQKNKTMPKETNELKNLEDLSFKNQSLRPDIDEELSQDQNADQSSKNKSSEILKPSEEAKLPNGSSSAKNSNKGMKEDYIDPNQFASIKLKHNLSSYNGINEIVDEEGDMAEAGINPEQLMTISEAFEDDDIVADFTAEKKEESEIKNAEVDLFMPGWGSWAGAGINHQEQAKRNKKLILTTDEKRKDAKKDTVLINEDANKHLRAHLVSDLPFPFTSLKDYEASIRAPIGRAFVPETAFKMLTRPAIITRKGQVIEPMDDSELVKPARRLRNVVDNRIQRMKQETDKTKVKSES